MVFWNLVIAIVSFILNLVLAPKPQNAKPSSLTDFNLPTAEEGIEIPVVFGTVNIKNPNVVWYGDFDSDPIKGKRRYGFFGPRQTIGYQYQIGMHMTLCHGCHDEIRNIWAGDKLLWSESVGSEGVISGTRTILIYKPYFYGGQDKEGGIWGLVDFLDGNPAQGPSLYLTLRLGVGAATPAFRGVVSCIWRNTDFNVGGLHIGTTTYVKPWEFQLKRIHRTSEGAQQWYDDKAAVPSTPGGADTLDMNPAHIIRECLTDKIWGMGYNAADIDDDSFVYAADTFYTECFGLSMQWNKEEKIEEFITIVLSHVDAYLYLRRDTGKFFLKPIRNDYGVAGIPVFDEDDVVSWDEIVRREPAESINSVIVKYTDRANRGKDASHQVDNIAQIQQLGERISATRFYPGIARGDLAAQAAARDQRSLGIGLISGRVTGKRTLDILYPGDPFRLLSSRHNLDGEIMRVVSMKFGDGRDNKIGIQFVEDVFKLGAADLVDISQGDWENPAIVTPAAVFPRLVWEAPYRHLRELMGAADTAATLADNPNTGVLVMAGGKPPGGIDAEMFVDGVDQGVMAFAPAGTVGTVMEPFDTTLTLDKAVSTASIVPGALAAIIRAVPHDTEIVQITDVIGVDLTLSRGMIDTIPRYHSPGESVVVFDGFSASDFDIRTSSTSPSVRLLTRTASDALDFSLAPQDVVDLDSRAIRPLRPANVKVEGFAIGTVDGSSLTAFNVTWANRNRLTELSTELAWTAATVTPEAGQTTVIEVLNESGTVITTHAGLTGTSFSVPMASFAGAAIGYIRVGAARDGYREWQAYAIECSTSTLDMLTLDSDDLNISGESLYLD